MERFKRQTSASSGCQIGIIPGHHFHVSGPPFRVAGKIQNAADGCCGVSAGVDRLIQVAGIAFMGKRGVQRRRAVAGSLVDINNILCQVIHRRCEIKGRTQIVFQRGIHVFDGTRYSRSHREVRSHFYLKIFQNGYRIGKRRYSWPTGHLPEDRDFGRSSRIFS